MEMVGVLVALFEQLVGMGSYGFRRHDLLLSELQAYYEPNDQSYSSDQNLYLGRKLPVIVYTKRAYRQPDDTPRIPPPSLSKLVDAIKILENPTPKAKRFKGPSVSIETCKM